mmetsp:Transcript_47069/g.123512  ORF Transcript_47069/g.123512 Transcript_47069/m.123512 type:complete len:223 (+) Transcript_47069:804-1472(+)
MEGIRRVPLQREDVKEVGCVEASRTRLENATEWPSGGLVDGHNRRRAPMQCLEKLLLQPATSVVAEDGLVKVEQPMLCLRRRHGVFGEHERPVLCAIAADGVRDLGRAVVVTARIDGGAASKVCGRPRNRVGDVQRGGLARAVAREAINDRHVPLTASVIHGQRWWHPGGAWHRRQELLCDARERFELKVGDAVPWDGRRVVIVEQILPVRGIRASRLQVDE